jgi:miniconductance mechanosensitive channel
MDTFIMSKLLETGLAERYAFLISQGILFLIMVLCAFAAHRAARKILLHIILKIIQKTKNTWDDIFLKNNVFKNLAHLAPAFVIFSFSGFFGGIHLSLQRISIAYMAVTGIFVIMAVLNSVDDIYKTFVVSREKPITGYLQIIKIFVYIIGFILVFGVLIDRSPWTLLSGIGALTAVLLLIFKDSILGFVAGIQIAANNMVHIGDWIEMPQYNADGDVIDISLTTVKVQNWDKTISSIPVYAFVSNSFKNWRGMSESGGRRICRSVNIDISSIRICTETMIERFEKIYLIADYIRHKKTEIKAYNKEHRIDTSIPVNSRRMTNIGTLRAYILLYLRNHPQINQEMTLIVRQLAPSETGVPMQIYAFSKDIVWANYEGIQSDIFDHIMAIIPEFDLRVFQNPTGSDFSKIIS